MGVMRPAPCAGVDHPNTAGYSRLHDEKPSMDEGMQEVVRFPMHLGVQSIDATLVPCNGLCAAKE